MSRQAAALYRGLRSPRLAVLLLLALAALSAVGTVTNPTGSAALPEARRASESVGRIVGLQKTHSSPLFLSLVALSAINVTACTWHRLVGRFRVRDLRLRGVSDLMIHASLLLLIAGGVLKALVGFVGTQNIHVGAGTDTLYDWRAGADVPIGFRVTVDEYREMYYPVRVKIGLRRAETGEKAALLEVVEGAEARSPEGDLKIRILGYEPDRGFLRIGATAGGSTAELDFSTTGGEGGKRSGGYEMTLVAYRADLKQSQALISVQESGKRVHAGWLGSNETLRHRGMNLFLTAWGTDEAGRKFCGIQFVRDPGSTVFWTGCVLLALAIPLHLLAKGRRSPAADQETADSRSR